MKLFPATHKFWVLAVLALAASIGSEVTRAQSRVEPATAPLPRTTPSAGVSSEAQASSAPSRVVERIDDTKLTLLRGNTYPSAKHEFDRGLVDPQLPMERIVMLLKRSPEQQAALESFMAQQYDPKSSNYHHWLQPEEFGHLYGPSDADITSITSWLQNHGFQIYQVNKGRVTLEFSGTAAQIQEAFHLEVHNYLVDGKLHIANDRDPQIPEALAPVIGGIASFHNFFPANQLVLGKRVHRDPKTGRVTPVDAPITKPMPQFGFTNESGNPEEDITPYDFATIYNLLPLWNSGITGKGQTIAISAVTDIYPSDVSTFRNTLGLGGFAGNINLIHNGSDPGVDQGSLVENTLDTEWSGATAPDADVDVVISGSTNSTFGGILSDQYIVENPQLFTIMSASYGQCEILLGTSGNSTMNSIYQQGSAEGISMFESSGDQGSTGCDNSDATTFPAPAKYGLQVNGDASSPYITAVGGTEFTWVDYRTTYWSDNNSSSNLSNALGYIPESPWNGTCTSQVLLDRYFNYFYGLTTLEQVCNQTAPNGSIDAPEFVKVTGGSGGVSSCITSDGSTFASCGGGYAQPSWQKGVVGMPGTTARYLPDVSLFASSGYPYQLNGSAYLICVASNGGGSSCNYGDPNQIVYQEVGGTSVSSPALAGIMALVQQKQGKAQGLANPIFYALHAKDNLTNCNSSTVGNGNACNFYDVTYGTIAQVCPTGSRNCVTNASGDEYGVVSGYATTTGYDQATGLGSVNATNLVNNWASVAGTTTTSLTLSPTSLTFASTEVGSTSAAQSFMLKNTGSASVTLNNVSITGNNASAFTQSSTNCPGTVAAGASCTIGIQFKPNAAGTLTATWAITDSASNSPQKVALTGTGGSGSALTVTLSPNSLTFPSTSVGSTSSAQSFTLKNTGSASVTLNSVSITGNNASSFTQSSTNCPGTVAGGASCTIGIQFKPTAAGTLTATWAITDSASNSPQKVALTGTGGSALTVTLSPSSLSFPSTTVGSTSAAQSFTLKNTGSTSLTLNSVSISGNNASAFTQSSTNCPGTVAAGASCTVAIQFKPTAAGTLTATWAITDNASNSPQKVALTGTGGSALTVTLSPNSLTFPSTSVGSTSSAQSFTLKNTGSASVTLNSVSIAGNNSSAFTQSSTNCPGTVAAGASCTVAIQFKPSAAGTLTATWAISDNASNSPQKVALTGTGGSAMTITLSPSSLSFPATSVGSTSSAQSFTLKNAGSTSITLDNVSISGSNASAFTQSSTNCPGTVAAGASCTVSIVFKPTAGGTLTATWAITDNASNSPQTMSLEGTGN